MNASDPTQRSRGPPNGASSGLNPRPSTAQESHNGVSPARSGGSQLSRAEKFEDEKRRIVESCFGKTDLDGATLESYITHIRILEDATHPSTPPPVHSPPENKKPRVIVVAVKKSGRVRMHKARENANGSFSIGKTWVLDDLTMIQTYVHSVPSTPEEQQIKDRAGGTGFIIHIQKPYYWEASTQKEKDFFILSLIKVFRKYTGGRLPELRGFDPQELEKISGLSGPFAVRTPQTSSPQTSTETGALAHGPSLTQSSRTAMPQQSDRSRGPGSDIRARPSQERSSRERNPQLRTPQDRPSQEHASQTRSSQERVLRTTDSNDRMPQIPGQYPSSEFVRNLNPQPLQPQPKNKRLDSPGDTLSLPSAQPGSSLRKQAGINSNDSLRNRQEREAPVNGLQGEERLRQNGAHATSSSPAFTSGLQTAALESRKLPSALRSGPPELWQAPAKEERPSIGSSRLSSSRNHSDTKLDSDGPPSAVAESSRDPSRDTSRNNSFLGNRTDNDEPSTRNNKSAGQHKDGSIFTDLPSNEKGHSVIPAVNDSSPTPNTKTDGAATEASTPPPADSDVPTAAPLESESHRPGLGPMIKKKSNKELASTFRKAATAYNAFKPRPGGAVEKLRNENEKSTNENDGVSGVFSPPSLAKETNREISQSDIEPAEDSQSLKSAPSTQIPTVNIEKLPGPSPETSTTSIDVKDPEPETESSEKVMGSAIFTTEDRRKKRRSDHSTKYAKILGINHDLLEGRTFEIESVFNDFGWVEGGNEGNSRVTFEQLQSGLRKEISRVEAGSWLGALESNDERVNAVGTLMDRVIAECEELDCLLTLYNVELGTLSEDVAYIEAQSQGLQVQTANQKLLHTELKTLLDTISISASDLSILKDASLNKTQGLQAIETTLSQLYTAMLTIDPKLRQQGTRPNTSDPGSIDRSSITSFGGSELSSMRAVREKKDGYRRVTAEFVQRLRQYMSVKFREAEAQTLDLIEQRRNDNAASNLTRLDYRLREKPRSGLWIYSPLMLFTREMEPSEWEHFTRMYESSAKKPYQDEFKDNIFAWKCKTRKPMGDNDTLFTTHEKEVDSLVGRKLTVKRNKTVRYDGARTSTGEKPKDGKVNAYEAFDGTFREMARLIFVEQNSLVDLFHINSLETSDFLDALTTAPEQRRGGDPEERKIADPDRDMAKKVLGIMEELYSSWPSELQALVDWVVKQDSLQGVGVLRSLELQLSELEDTNQEFLAQTITKVHERLVTVFERFLDEQIRGIEDTKVKIKKRKGVISFMKTFPNFAATIENMLPPLRNLPTPTVRNLINDAYQKINKTIFESLKFIAKESPTTGGAAPSQNPIAGGTSGDPEDKEALNYHILLIENMNHYIEEVSPRENPVLEEWKTRASKEMDQHMHLYISAITRRPLGKLLDFLESTESLLSNSTAPISTAALAARASHSRSTFRKILAQYDGKEIRRGIETLRKRVEKHFGDADEAELSRGLVVKVLKAAEGLYMEVGERANRVIKEVYEGGLELEWRREDVIGGLRR